MAETNQPLTLDESERRIESRITGKHRLTTANGFEKNQLTMKLSGLEPDLYSFVTDSSFCIIHNLLVLEQHYGAFTSSPL